MTEASRDKEPTANSGCTGDAGTTCKCQFFSVCRGEYLYCV